MRHGLKKVGFARYKAFASRQEIELRPITILFGHNSAGKSAALRVLPVLSSAAAKVSSRLSVPSVLDYNHGAIRGANFFEIINQSNSSSTIQFDLSWDNISYTFDIKDIGKRDGEVITAFTISDTNGKLEGVLGGSEGDQLYDLRLDDEPIPHRATFKGVRPLATTGERVARWNAFLRLLEARLDDLSSNIHWIGATRERPPRLYKYSPGTSYHIRPDGSGVGPALRASFLAADGVAEATSAWLAKTCGCELALAETDRQAIAEQSLYAFQVRTVSGGATVSIQDVGEGIAQALPVVTLCHQAAKGLLGESPILAMEQPELHLHPRAAVHLADEIVSCVAQNSPAMHVIETHSESIILSIQTAIASKAISPSQVILYWVTQEELGSALRPVTFDGDGYPSEEWPSGVFRETLEQARVLASIRNG